MVFDFADRSHQRLNLPGTPIKGAGSEQIKYALGLCHEVRNSSRYLKNGALGIL